MMKLPADCVSTEQLAAVAAQAAELLRAGRFADLASCFGYAVALGRDPVAAIRQDMEAGIAELGGQCLYVDRAPQVQVTHLKPGFELHAMAEAVLVTSGGRQILMEVVFTKWGGEVHATLEQISVVGLA